jgi:hypothetical protein
VAEVKKERKKLQIRSPCMPSLHGQGHFLLEHYFGPAVYGFARVACTPALRLLVVKLTSVFLFYTKGDKCAQTVNILI